MGTDYNRSLTGDPGPDLAEFDEPPADAMALLRDWLAHAEASGAREPGAFTLATVDDAGRPTSRTLLLHAVDERGLLWGTATGSQKGRDLAVRPWASATFYWRETLRQINLGGVVERLSDAESDAQFAERPLVARAAAAASEQSARLDDERLLRKQAAALTSTGSVPRPEGWSAYRLVPSWVELWHGRTDRLHRRLRFDRTADTGLAQPWVAQPWIAQPWVAQRLQP